MLRLTPIDLTPQVFAPFGEVIELQHARKIDINEGLTTRYDDLFTIDVDTQQGQPSVSLFRTQTLPLPHQVVKMERHPLGSQAFLPVNNQPFLVLVGSGEGNVMAKDLKLFITDGKQGINFHRNTWHHHNMVIDGSQDFIVVDRKGDGNNLQEVDITEQVWVSL